MSSDELLKKKYAALISYVGTDFCGWQKQKEGSGGAPSIQASVEEALKRMTRVEKVSVVGSGRTDSGVHAVGQVVHFVLNQDWELEILKRGLNALLPRSVRVLGVQAVPLDFHAQRSAVKKQYSYYFQQGPSVLPYLEPYSWWIHKRLDLGAMHAGLQNLVGEFDFKPFQASGAKPGPTVRRILEAEVSWEPITFPSTPGQILGAEKTPFGLVRVRLLGTGFLKQMVRGIAGTLLQVGEGRRPPSCFKEILETQSRQAVGPTAPARALWLEKVWYSGLNW